MSRLGIAPIAAVNLAVTAFDLAKLIGGNSKKKAERKAAHLEQVKTRRFLMSGYNYASRSLDDQGLLPMSPFGTVAPNATYGVITPFPEYGAKASAPITPYARGANAPPLTERDFRVIREHQAELVYWFQTLLEHMELNTSRFTEHFAAPIMNVAENYLRKWDISPTEYYKVLMTLTGEPPSVFAPYSTLARSIPLSSAAPTAALIASTVVATASNQLTRESANPNAPLPVITQSSNPNGALVATPAPSTMLIPTTQAASPATQSGVTQTRVAPVIGASSAPDWNKWAMPLAVIAAALIGSSNRALE